MAPVIDKVNTEAAQPYLAGTIETTVRSSARSARSRDSCSSRRARSDIATFVRIAGGKGFAKPSDVPLSILVPAFVTSELKTAFQIGFLLFIPFVIIDLVVASVLMSMGMMMLSPVLISLPFKIMLFVLIDGWALVMGTLAQSFFR
jgi:flagellar biosynthetic protein FliP